MYRKYRVDNHTEDNDYITHIDHNCSDMHGTLPQQPGCWIESIVTTSTWINDGSHYVTLVMYAVYTCCGEKLRLHVRTQC